jgi:hypothetical protein
MGFNWAFKGLIVKYNLKMLREIYDIGGGVGKKEEIDLTLLNKLTTFLS